MRKLKTLVTSLFLVLIQCQLVYAESIESGVKSSKNLLNLGTAVIIGFLTLGVMITGGGMFLDVLKQQRLKIYMEIAVYLIALLIPLTLALIVLNTIKGAAN